MRTPSHKQVGSGPWWLVATFDADWNVLSVEAQDDPGEVLVDEGEVKTLRLIDEPFTDWKLACRTAFQLRFRYEGRSGGPVPKPGQASVTCKAMHVDRNPPNSPNRFV